ncbi:MAG: secretion protein HlyD [Alphaproteobacteria bacterium]
MKIALRILILLLILGATAYGFHAYNLGAGLGLIEEEKPGLELYGNVDIRQVELGFRVGGRIAEMRFEEGDPVEAGDEMARLDQRPYQDKIRMAEAEVDRESANLAKLEAGTRPEEIAQAEAAVAEREAALVNARRQFERQESLVKNDVASRRSFDDAKALLDEAEARLTSAQKALDLAKKGFRSEDVAAARAGLAAARARKAAAETALDDTTLQAPADGVTLSRVREPGAIVASGETVYTLSLERPIWVRAYVPEPLLGALYPGQAVEVVSNTRPDQPYRGQIGFISPVAEFTPKTVETPELRAALVYRLRVVIEAETDGLRQGMPVTVHIAPPTDGGVDQKEG